MTAHKFKKKTKTRQNVTLILWAEAHSISVSTPPSEPIDLYSRKKKYLGDKLASVRNETRTLFRQRHLRS